MFFKLSSASQQTQLILFFLFCSIFFRLWWLWQPRFLLTVPTATILGGPDLHVDKGSTINLTCTVKFSPEPPAYIFWYHHEEVIKLYCYISASMPSLFLVYSSSAYFLKVSAGTESCLSMSLIFIWRGKRDCWSGKEIIMISYATISYVKTMTRLLSLIISVIKFRITCNLYTDEWQYFAVVSILYLSINASDSYPFSAHFFNLLPPTTFAVNRFYRKLFADGNRTRFMSSRRQLVEWVEAVEKKRRRDELPLAV